jgi:hypothetical protein
MLHGDVSILVRLVLLAVVALGCGAPPGTERADLQAYLDRTKGWAPVEAETARTLERILATEFVDEAEVRHQIEDSRPRILTHLERVRAYTPRSAAVQRIHETYIKAWQSLLEGYDAIVAGFTSGDYTRLAAGREDMARWKEGIVRAARDLRELSQRLGVSTERATPT